MALTSENRERRKAPNYAVSKPAYQLLGSMMLGFELDRMPVSSSATKPRVHLTCSEPNLM